MQFEIIIPRKFRMRAIALIFGFVFLSATGFSETADELSDVPQAWYSLDGSHVAVFQNDGESWYAQISKSDGGEVLWGTEIDRPLSGCVANDGASIAIVTGTLNRKESLYTKLRLAVVTDDDGTFSHEVPGTSIVESMEADRESVLALADVEFQRGKPVVTFTSVGRVVGRIQIGDNAAGGTMKLPASKFAADSTRRLIAQAMQISWKLAGLAKRPKLAENHLVAPMSTGILAACILKARTPSQRNDVWERLLAKLHVTVGPDYSVDDWLFGLKATGCFSRRVPTDAMAPEISSSSLRHKKYLLRESPSRFWTGMISVSNTAAAVSRTKLDLATQNEWLSEALDEFTTLPSIKIRRFRTTDDEMSLRSLQTFAAEWAYPFNAADVQHGNFQNPLVNGKSASAVLTKFVKGAQEFCQLAQSDGRRLARIPLLDGYCVLFLLSDNAEEYQRTDDLLFGGDVPLMLKTASWKETKLNCEFPVFGLSQKLSVLDQLQFLANEGNPFVSGLNSNSHLSLADASQSAMLQIDHDGVSSVSSPIKHVSSISPGESLIVDRPFHVCVLADGSEFPILVARVTSPEVLAR